MNPRERGFLLLTSQLGNPERKPLTAAQLRTLTARMASMEQSPLQRDVEPGDLTALGYGAQAAAHIVALLNQEAELEHYLHRARRAGCYPVTRVSPLYPSRLRRQLGADAPGCLWARGDLSLLGKDSVSLVGSRKLEPVNQNFAWEAGRQAALQGYVLVSGNARGADREAQNACLSLGGSVISVVADELQRQNPAENVLFLSEEDFDAPFSPLRALRRNRVIHALSAQVLVAQTGMQQGGTWDGTAKNLRFGWSRVYCYRDGSQGSDALIRMGAAPIGFEDLGDYAALPRENFTFFD